MCWRRLRPARSWPATTRFRLGEKVDDPLQMYLADIYTIPVNLAGLPGISVPCGFSSGLPIGLQLIGKPFDEATVLRAAYAYEQGTEWHTRRPPLIAQPVVARDGRRRATTKTTASSRSSKSTKSSRSQQSRRKKRS